MLKGVDLSHWQENLNIDTILDSVDCCVVKLTQGTKYKDKKAMEYVKKAKEKNVLRGYYHFMTNEKPEEQADFFVKTLMDNDLLFDGILVCDFETEEIISFQGNDGLLRFLERVTYLTGIRPIIYMSFSPSIYRKWSEHIKKNYGLWVARYMNCYNGTTHITPNRDYVQACNDNGWTVTGWQYTSSGYVGTNKPLDLDIFYMSEKGWNAYATNGKNVSRETF